LGCGPLWNKRSRLSCVEGTSGDIRADLPCAPPGTPSLNGIPSPPEAAAAAEVEADMWAAAGGCDAADASTLVE
jgi:hypothetical protein